MGDDADVHHPTAGQYRDWAKLLRQQAEAVSTATDRLHLLRIADELDRLADSIGGSAAARKKGADRG